MNINKDKRPVVYHIITKLELGGAQKVTIELLKNIDRARFSAGLISGADGEMVDDARQIPDCRIYLLKELVHPIKIIHDIRALCTIRRILKNDSVDIVHTHSSKAGIIGRWAAFFAGVPVRIHSVHGWSFNDYQRWFVRAIYIFLEKLTSRITSYFFLEAKKHIEIGLEKKFLKKGNHELLLPGIDFQHFDKYLKSPERKPIFDEYKRSGKRIVTMIACLKPQKAPVDFVRAASLALKRIPDLHFVLVGDGILRKTVEEEVRSLDIQDKISILGWRMDIVEIIGSSDLIVLTSRWEGLPTVIPMAMRMHVPVVANRIDGCMDLIREGENGLLSEPANTADIADNIVRILSHSSLYKKIAKNGRKSSDLFDIKTAAAIQQKVYDSLYKKMENGLSRKKSQSNN